MELDIEKIEQLFASGEKSVSIHIDNEMDYFGENGIIQSIFADSNIEKEFRKLLNGAGFSAKKNKESNGFVVTTIREGYSLILETANNGNFEEVKRLAKVLDEPTHEGLQLCHEGWIVKLNKHNSDLVERMVEMNDTYSISFAKYVYMGIRSEHGGEFPKDDEKAIEAMIRVIDRDNSTQVWQHDKNRIKNMRDFILKSENDFWGALMRGDPELVEKLINGSRTSDDDSDLVSLSSKVCKYLLEYETGDKDKYFISDRFVRRALPFYCDTFNIEVDNFKLSASFFEKKKTKEGEKDYPYSELFKVLEKLQQYANDGKSPDDDDYLDKHRIDHILWFCYRSGSEVEEKKRKASANQ